jgi:two-component system, chemotaxis family, chemotaxis protein CheY
MSLRLYRAVRSESTIMHVRNKASIETFLKDITILVVDGNGFMRRMTRMMLLNLGARSIREAADGLAAVEQIRTWSPDVMLLDWDLPVLNGMEVMRIVRSPGVFPRANLPTIMLTSQAKRSLVVEALRVGVHEFLVKPTSPKALCDRLMSVMIKPRPLMRVGEYYVPEPRLRQKSEADSVSV